MQELWDTLQIRKVNVYSFFKVLKKGIEFCEREELIDCFVHGLGLIWVSHAFVNHYKFLIFAALIIHPGKAKFCCEKLS